MRQMSFARTCSEIFYYMAYFILLNQESNSPSGGVGGLAALK